MQASRPCGHSSVGKEKGGGGGDRKVVSYINRSRWNWVRGGGRRDERGREGKRVKRVHIGDEGG